MPKTGRQLQREINAALSGRRHSRGRSRHHSSIAGPSAAEIYSVAIDVLLELEQLKQHGQAKTAAAKKLVQRFHAIQQEILDKYPNASPPAKFTSLYNAVIKPVAKPSAQAVAFFRKNAGYSYKTGAVKSVKAKARTAHATSLAQAEAEAEARGWTVRWEDDPEEWQGCDERPFEVLNAVLLDESGQVLESIGSVGMSGNRSTDRDYGRVIEAELAEEALAAEARAR